MECSKLKVSNRNVRSAITRTSNLEFSVKRETPCYVIEKLSNFAIIADLCAVTCSKSSSACLVRSSLATSSSSIVGGGIGFFTASHRQKSHLTGGLSRNRKYKNKKFLPGAPRSVLLPFIPQTLHFSVRDLKSRFPPAEGDGKRRQRPHLHTGQLCNGRRLPLLAYR